MASRMMRFRVWYAGGETDEWTEMVSEEQMHYYSDGGKGPTRLNEMAERRDYKGRKVNCVTMAYA